MEDKRGTKRSHSSVSGSSSSPSNASTLPPYRFGSPPPPASPPEVSSHRPMSTMYEHGGPSNEISVVDLSSEDDIFPNTSWDEEFARRLFGDLNYELLGLCWSWAMLFQPVRRCGQATVGRVRTVHVGRAQISAQWPI
jgi:hypothetical protein